ncbi:HAD-IA family hydrolase [Candidatus Woesearchaeota archaeon]|nr:HAD-IA family hydrolase [Candidatus Woesearchaeota archaeon]
MISSIKYQKPPKDKKSIKIKGIIFDYGGVLSPPGSLRPICEKFAPEYGVDIEKMHKILVKNWHKARIAKISDEEFWKNLAYFLGTDKDSFKKDFLKYPQFDERFFELINNLKNRYRIGLLSNHIRSWLGKDIKEKNLKDIFDVIVTSYDAKLAKPDIKIFELIVKKMKLKPEECIYIDDQEKNMHPSSKMGMYSILYTDFNQLKKELKNIGIKV